MPSSSSVAWTAPDWRGVAEVRLERDRVEGHEGVHDPPDLAGPAEQPDVRSAVRHDGEVAHRRADERAHERHRLAARSPAADPDGHAVAYRADDVVDRHAFVGNGHFSSWS